MKKKLFGQFYTRNHNWLTHNIIEFIKATNTEVVFDPFAGNGDIFKALSKLGFEKFIGMDIDNTLNWIENDSLVEIPRLENTIIVTNPPYLTHYSASRKGYLESVKKYFNNSKYDDLYLVALDRMLEANKFVVAIVPETFINSNYQQKDILHSITILEENPFNDTTTPVCVLCFDNILKNSAHINVFKGDQLISNLYEIENSRLNPKYRIKINFNVKDGWLALRAVDSTDPYDRIRFDYPSKIDYNWVKGIKNSSRLLTLIDIEVENIHRQEFIIIANEILNFHRKNTNDLSLSPFKGNNKSGIRRRRLDYRTARAILEIAREELFCRHEKF